MTGFSPKVRELLRARASVDGFVVCEVMAACQGRAAAVWEAHHRRPRGMGSSRRPDTNLPANGLMVCGDCHRFIESNRSVALSNRWLLRQNETPTDIPVLRRHVWVLLDNEGGFVPAECVCGEIGSDGWVPGPCSCVEG